MMKNNPTFSIKNFRSFGNDGADFELAPITVLTGCNSAGKSSLVKALILLSEKQYEVFEDEVLNFSTRQLCLGGYKSVANNEADIILSYRIWSNVLNEEVIVTRTFCAHRNDTLGHGFLKNITIEKLDKTSIFQGKYFSHRNYDNSLITKYLVTFCAAGIYTKMIGKFLPILKLREEKKHQNQEVSVEQVFTIASETLDFAGLSKEEAVSLWNGVGNKVFSEFLDKILSSSLPSLIELSEIIKDSEKIERLLINPFIDIILDDVCTPSFVKDIIYVNSSSAQIARLYSTEDENKMCRALRDYNRRIRECSTRDFMMAPPPLAYTPGEFMNKWIKEFEVGEKLEIKGTDEGLGIMAYLVKGENEEDKRLLADEGYGITQLISLLLQIDNSIQSEASCEDESILEADSIVSNILYKRQPKTICVEEPEVHLHPKYQSMLAEMFVEAYQKYNIRFIIETHSEYLIRKLQVMVADKNYKLQSEDVSLNYVEKNKEGISFNRQIKIMDDGRLDGSFGEGFFDAAGSLSRQLFMLND